MMGRKYWTLIAVLSICALFGAGCKRKSSRNTTITNSDDDIFTTDEFPGAPVQNGNVADDGRAMSVSSEDFDDGLEYFADGSSGRGILKYHTNGDDNMYVHYYNGETWTPPIAVRAYEADASSTDYDATVVAFIHPNDDGDDDDQNRAGDAIIFWVANDVVQSPAIPGDGNNQCVWSTYVDISETGNAANNYGFQEYADRVSMQDESGENISVLGLVSDGLCGEARWDDNGHSYSWGDDATTAIVVFWQQTGENDGAGTDIRTHFSRFDPDESIAPEIPLTPGADSTLDEVNIPFADETGLTSEETTPYNLYCSYNDFLFSRVAYVFAGTASFETEFSMSGDEVDEVCQYVKFNLEAATTNTAVSLNPASIDTSDGLENDGRFIRTNQDNYARNSIYGSDEGVAVMVEVHVQNQNVDYDGGASTVEDSGLMLSEIDQADGSLDGQSFVDLDDVTIYDSVRSYLVDSRISRNGDYIWFAWYEETDLGAFIDRSGWCACYHTTRYNDDGTFTSLGLATALDAPFNYMGDIDTQDQIGVMWQDGLGYVCGAQSDPDMMTLFYLINTNTGDEEVFRVVLTVDPALETSGAVTTPYYTFDDTNVQSWDRFPADVRRDFNATDAGSNGDVFIAYREDIGFPVYDDDRLFAQRLGGASGFSEIDMFDSNFQVRGFMELTLIGTPRGSDIGEYNDVDAEDSESRPHGFSNVHVIFGEYETGEYGSNGYALRTRQYRTDTSRPFLDAFVPSIAGGSFERPFDLDLPFIDPSDDAQIQGWGVSGDTVGIWFSEIDHMYYQEFSENGDDDSVGWLNNEGQSNPYLVDDDNSETMNDWGWFFTRSCTCDTLDGAMVFWTKYYMFGSYERLQVRVRGDGN